MPSNNNSHSTMTLREAAHEAGLSYEAMRQHLLSGNVRYTQDDAGRYAIRRRDFEEWVKKPRRPGRPYKYFRPLE